MLPPPARLRHGLFVIAIALLVGCSGSSTVEVTAPGTPDSLALSLPASSPPPTPAHEPSTSGSRRHPGVPAVDVPNHALTPGVAFPVGLARICVPGYASSVRDVTDAEKTAVYARYHVAWVPYQHEVDHLISLEIGGSNAIQNLWPEPYAGRWGARTKDVLENRLHDLVCAGDLPLVAAQHQEASDWVAAYLRYVGTPPGGGGGSTSPGGYYASSYPTASTIYCADDPEWHNLSPTYLVHFATLAQAFARFPGYHLHQPC